MIADLLWLIRCSLRCWVAGPRLDRNGLAWIGLILQLTGLLLGAAILADAWGGVGTTGIRLILLAGAGILFCSGSAGVCFGSHLPRTPQSSGLVPGAELLTADGPPEARDGLLVIVCGYGSESPAFCEPEFLRQPLSSDTLTEPLLRQYRRRVFLHLHGGIGWCYRPVEEIAAGLDTLLRQDDFARLVRQRQNLVIGHSRGCQVVAATAVFRNPDWKRVAVHPPAGVQPYLLAFAAIDPGIAEIHRFGGRMNGPVTGMTGPTLATFPWNRILQARGFDNTVWRLDPAPGRPVENCSAFGAHITPFSRSQAPLWEELRQQA